MPRRGTIRRRPVQPDSRYGRVDVTQFINKIMTRGKKSLAERIFYGAMDRIAEQRGGDAMEVFELAMRNATPAVEVRPRRVGGATYQVPMEIRTDRRTSLAIRWLLQSARARPGRTMVERLAAELLDTAQGNSGTTKRREDTHRMAEAKSRLCPLPLVITAQELTGRSPAVFAARGRRHTNSIRKVRVRAASEPIGGTWLPRSGNYGSRKSAGADTQYRNYRPH